MILISRMVLQIHPKYKKWFKNSTNIPLLLSYLLYNFGILRKIDRSLAVYRFHVLNLFTTTLTKLSCKRLLMTSFLSSPFSEVFFLPYIFLSLIPLPFSLTLFPFLFPLPFPLTFVPYRCPLPLSLAFFPHLFPLLCPLPLFPAFLPYLLPLPFSHTS